MNNLYWNVYRSLERELLDIADTIHIDDEQLSTYSMRIANLLVRTVIEIESISKELYFREGGKWPLDEDSIKREEKSETEEGSGEDSSRNKNVQPHPYFDTNCLDFLENKWTLSERMVVISTPRLYLVKEPNMCFKPLKGASKRGKPSWKKAYQDVKHNRGQSLKKGTLDNVIHALGALFLLNLYYKDQRFDLYKDEEPRDFDEHLGSSIFTVKIHPFSGYINPGYTEDDAVDECVYLIRITDESKARIQYGLQRLNSTLQSPGLASALPPRINLTQDQFNRIDDFRQKIKELDTPSFPYVAIPGECMVISTDWIKDMLQGILDGIEYEVVTNKGQYKKHPM
ncbi:MAG: hypothetical protein HXN23_09845 [Porphyromonas sp.]|uniref:hypothetical protein n=1 Tax=Porphyromonas sp. TaxID=1924944 RepID=UPI001CACB4FB|nr:hypothetical protein [Porphyromonas sp.]MBF1406502.1 hypothetical protein [Porphyromonas sp.]